MNNEQAFPIQFQDGWNKEQVGLTKREYFTAMALAGLCATDITKEATARLAVEIADLTLTELNKQHETTTPKNQTVFKRPQRL